MKEVSKLHGIVKSIVPNKDTKFTYNCWKGLLKGFYINLNMSRTYHLQKKGQTKRFNQMIEYMLRMYVMDQPYKLEDYLHLLEFSYNNGCHVSLKMSHIEALCGRKCSTPISGII